jgi:hemolysin III
MAVPSADLALLGAPRPLLRGWSHVAALLAAATLCSVMIGLAPGHGARATMIAYLVGLCGMFGVSSLFHRVSWGPDAHRLMGRIDHCAIFGAIAGTYTPVAFLSLDGWPRATVLALVWGGGLLGIILEWAPVRLPRWLFTALYVVVGWAALAAMPQLYDSLGLLGFLLLFGGGVAYTIGAAVYALQRPDPWPRVFGFHEVFHICTVAGAGLHLSAIGFVVLAHS